jgi:hypothetical protein
MAQKGWSICVMEIFQCEGENKGREEIKFQKE